MKILWKKSFTLRGEKFKIEQYQYSSFDFNAQNLM